MVGVIEKRERECLSGLCVIITGEYNIYGEDLVESAQNNMDCHLYIFTDQVHRYSMYENVTLIEIPHVGWPQMPLLRFELLAKYKDLYKEEFMFMIDADVEFKQRVVPQNNWDRVVTLHRNIMRLRKDFNYEKRKESTAYISDDEGEKYYACAFSGGRRKEFIKMCQTIGSNIRKDISKGIRAIWGDESHTNRYFIDNEPTAVLPPSYMCPSNNPHFIPYIQHQNKPFKSIYLDDAKNYMTIDPDEYNPI